MLNLSCSFGSVSFYNTGIQNCAASMIAFSLQSKRLGALNKFKSKNRSILIATDVASRLV